MSKFQIADGVNGIVVGKLGEYESPLVLVGGNCSIQGFDYEGNDEFWTVSKVFIPNGNVNNPHIKWQLCYTLNPQLSTVPWRLLDLHS